jgi:hypothetical protein
MLGVSAQQQPISRSILYHTDGQMKNIQCLFACLSLEGCSIQCRIDALFSGLSHYVKTASDL